jgi:hypothetical protein
MSTTNGGPDIVNSGLILHLDTANKKSYIGTGATWTDLSVSKNNATLFNTPTYNTANAGYFNFDKTVYEYATATNPGSLSNWSIEAFFRVTGSLTGQVTMVVGGQYDLVSNLNFSIGTNRAASSYNICVGFFNGAWRNTDGFAPSLNVWYHVVGTYNGATVIQYNNGILNTQLSYTGTSQSGGEIRIGRRWDESATNSINFFPGDISVVRIYNRAISATEVLQNYNALKSRFNLL